MNAQEAFRTAYPGGETNFMTPTVLRRKKLPKGRGFVELSTGRGMSCQIWGVTVLDGQARPDHDRSKGGFASQTEAEAYIAELAEAV